MVSPSLSTMVTGSARNATRWILPRSMKNSPFRVPTSSISPSRERLHDPQLRAVRHRIAQGAGAVLTDEHHPVPPERAVLVEHIASRLGMPREVAFGHRARRRTRH